MKLPKIKLYRQDQCDPIATANGKVLRPWRYPLRKIDGSDPLHDACRMVYLIRGRWVLKVDRGSLDETHADNFGHQAAKEIRTWLALDAADLPHFCKLLAWQTPRGRRRGWVLQPRLRFRPGPLPLAGWRTVLALASKYRLRDFKGFSPNSPLDNNWRMATQRGRAVPVIYDYGY